MRYSAILMIFFGQVVHPISSSDTASGVTTNEGASVSDSDSVTSIDPGKLSVDCSHMGATSSDIESLIPAIPVTNNDLLMGMLLTFCPAHRKLRVPDRLFWSWPREYIPAWLLGKKTKSGDTIAHLNPKPLYRSADRSVAYGIENSRKQVIKYSKFCPGTNQPLDTTVNEAFFMTYLKDAGIAPRFYYYSGYADEQDYIIYGVPKLDIGTCEPSRDGHIHKPHIRYIIMADFGISLEEIMLSQEGSRFPFLTAIKIGGQMIELLKKLHSFNIAHGDVQLANFGLRLSPDSSSEIVFLDFSRAHFEVPQVVLRSNVAPEARQYDFLKSKWEVNGWDSTYRDDVYQAVKMIGYAMRGASWRDEMEGMILRMKTDPDAERLQENYSRIMNGGFFFNSPYDETFRLSKLIGKEAADLVVEYLVAIRRMAISENPDNPNEKPDYDGILANLKQIIHKLTRTTIDDPNIFKFYRRN